MKASRRKHHGSASRAAPPLRHEDESAEGADILRELPSPAGVLLAAALRDVMLWVEAPAAARDGLFTSGAAARRTRQIRASEVEPDLWTPLLTLACMTEETEVFDDSRILHACRRVVGWAEENGAPAVRLAFTQAMAVARPADAGLALQVGRLARDAAQYARAETWLRWAIQLARGSKDHDTYVSGYIALGVLYRRMGNHPAAYTVAGRAVRAAKRYGLSELEGLALHNLFIFASDGPDVRRAYGFVREAAQAYGQNPHRLAVLAHDVASFWCDNAQYTRAAPVIEAVLPRMEAAFERALAASNLARALAGAGDREHYESARRMAIELIETLPGTAHRADAFLTVARADTLLEEWERAESAASSAAEIAARRGEAHVLIVAETELAAIRACRAAEAEATTSEESPGLARHAERLAVDLIRTLERIAA